MAELPFESFNEAAVQGEVIEPLLKQLGYASGTANNIIREYPLRYPRMSLGRKDTKKDQILRGKADYILEVQGRLRWVLEAKAPDIKLGVEQIEQAWTYASHAEVRAIYFVLCNGRTLVIYRTINGPNAPPVVSLSYEQLGTDFTLLANVLGPQALLRDFQDVELDYGRPLAPGLRSIALVTNGLIRYDQNSLGSSALSELQHSIEEGELRRDSDGRLVAFLHVVSASHSLHEFNERLGLSSFEMVSQSSELSTDPVNPTVFVYENRIILPAGEGILDVSSWKEVQLPFNLTCDVRAEARGSFQDGMFLGSLTTQVDCQPMQIKITMSGSFKALLV